MLCNRYLTKSTFWILFALFMASCKEVETPQQPNIVFIMADDMGWADLSVYGNRFNESPNLERLASEGMQFENAYAACPVCSPTRASIQSGQYPARVGVIDFIPGHYRPYEEVDVPRNTPQNLPLNITSLGEAMKSAGYATGYFGKWHLGFYPEHHPSKRGYESAVEYKGGGFFNSKFDPAQQTDPKRSLAEVLTDFSCQFIDENKNKPFFLFLSHYDVHVQLDADSATIHKYLKKEKVDGYPCNAVYAAMVEAVDKSVGRVLQKLNDEGLSDNTLVFFFSDNGGLITRYDKIPLITKDKQHIYKEDTLLYIATSNAPLRGEKGTVYEGGIREPFIARWPGKIEAGSKSEAIISSVDFYPTLLEVAGASLPNTQIFDGKSILKELTTNTFDPERAIFWHYPVYHHDVPKSAIRKGNWKLIQNLVDSSVVLYNLKNDLSETTDLSSTNTIKTTELLQLLEKWRTDTKAAMPWKNPNFDPLKRNEWGQHADWNDAVGIKSKKQAVQSPKN